jgi:hypothetical protein
VRIITGYPLNIFYFSGENWDHTMLSLLPDRSSFGWIASEFFSKAGAAFQTGREGPSEDRPTAG